MNRVDWIRARLVAGIAVPGIEYRKLVAWDFKDDRGACWAALALPVGRALDRGPNDTYVLLSRLATWRKAAAGAWYALKAWLIWSVLAQNFPISQDTIRAIDYWAFRPHLRA